MTRSRPSGLLQELLANPKLDKSSPGYLLIERDLGILYCGQAEPAYQGGRRLRSRSQSA